MDVFAAFVVGEDDDAGLGVDLADGGDGVEAGDAGQAQIHDGDVGLVLAVEADGFGALVGLGDDLHVFPRIDDGVQGEAGEVLVFNQKYANRVCHSGFDV